MDPINEEAKQKAQQANVRLFTIKEVEALVCCFIY
jgi:hypothetical protein